MILHHIYKQKSYHLTDVSLCWEIEEKSCFNDMKILVILTLNNYTGTYACVWGIIGDYIYTCVTSYPREGAY